LVGGHVLRAGAIALTVLVLACGVAHAGYRGAEWGMTPEQVAAVIPEAKLADSDMSDGKRQGNKGELIDGGRRVRATFYYDQRGLTRILLVANYHECKAVLTDLLAAHGDPYRISDQVLFRLFIWHDPPKNNRLRLMVSTAKVCDLHYERLDDYKAVDDEQAAQGK
jgi:hypothetical protein